MGVGSPRPTSSLAANMLAEVTICFLIPRGELRPKRDAICPKLHTPNHKGTSKCSSYSLRLRPLCQGLGYAWMLSRPGLSKPPDKAANRLADKEENPTSTATERSWM